MADYGRIGMRWDIAHNIYISAIIKLKTMENDIIKKAKKMLKKADTGTNECKLYNNGFMDGVQYAIEQLHESNDSHCACAPEETTGETSVMCCNFCGKPTESFWRVGNGKV